MIVTNPIANWETTRTGKVRAICEHCDRRSKPVAPGQDGRPDFWEIRGWSEAPYPAGFEHGDGSKGSLYRCPSCIGLARRRKAAGITPLLTPTNARRQARMERRGAVGVPAC